MLGLRRYLTIGRLGSGGLITNYFCTSRCGHCLYACSSQWERTYIDEATVRANFSRIAQLGCHSVHVGGGEPFLDMDGLRMVLRVAAETEMRIEYVETNSSWYGDVDSAVQTLTSLRAVGLSTLLISISPFHNEFIPFHKVKGVIEACRKTGISAFPWISDFYPEIDSLDDSRTHKIREYEEFFGKGYLKNLPSRYWIHLGGRALSTFSSVFRRRPAHLILSSARGGCGELTDVSHFHFDLFGNYIPGLYARVWQFKGTILAPLSHRKSIPSCPLFSEKVSQGSLKQPQSTMDLRRIGRTSTSATCAYTSGDSSQLKRHSKARSCNQWNSMTMWRSRVSQFRSLNSQHLVQSALCR